MKEHTIPRVGWSVHLSEAIEAAEDGDMILCHSPSMIELAERARQRMCPEKKLVLREEGPSVDMGRIHQKYEAD